MNSLQPIEIIGGGLAGLSLGLALRHHDVPVTIFESGNYPRHRVCGEFIAGLSDETIARLGLGPHINDALLHSEVAWFMNERLTSTQSLPSPARAISRHRLDARLAAAFVEAGGTLSLNTRITDISPQTGRICTTGRRRSSSAWLGLKIHARTLALLSDLEFHLGHDAYLGLTQIEHGKVNICGLFRRREIAAKGPELLLAYLRAANLPALAERLNGVDFDVDSFSAVAAVGFDRHVTSHNQGVSLGDACAMIPPFTGNGMAMAFQSAETALDPLLAYARRESPWPATSTTIEGALQRRFRVRLATAELVHPFLLRPNRQRWLTRFAQAGLLPLRPLYAALH